MEDIIVRAGPAEYECKKGVLNLLESKLTVRSIKRALLLTGERSWQAASHYFPDLKDIQLEHVFYNGECSLSEISRVTQLALTHEVDAIIGVGGGKVLDVVKAASYQSQTKSILIPTLAANCASWTPLSVIYSDEGVMTHYDVYPLSVDLLLIEPRILVEAPIPYLIAGIGDTLAKWYEADVQIGKLNDLPVALKIAHYSAKLCADEMFEHAEQAVNDAKEVRISNAFIKVIESILMIGGMVGGYGDKFGRIAGAHSIHNGITVAPGSHKALHGHKVAYGILVQLLLENKVDELERLIPFYQVLGLPITLKDLSVSTTWIDEIATLATRERESIHLIRDKKVTHSEVAEIMRKWEAQWVLNST
ncbi:MAG: iron-containing alcohol dehydrogenase family protein [Paenisporosarcina sp.]